MGEEESLAAMSAPVVTLERKSGSQIALALTVFALVLASNSIINESWLTSSTETGDTIIQSDIGLHEISVEACSDGLCESESESIATLYDDCKGDCDEITDWYNAGNVATIMLILAGIILFSATILQVRSMLGHNSRLPNFVSGGGGIFVALSILVWSLIIPESEIDLDWGQGLWLAIVASTCGIVAGMSGILQSWIDGPPRMRAHGVRSGSGMNEFVLKESSCGNHTLSILVDSDLIRVAKIDRIGASASTKDILATRRDSYTGFSHQRMDWLDDFKGVWWVVGGASLISSFMISILFLIPFILASTLALFQLMDPERFVISTNSGNHPFYINRWRSNRELTNLAMDLVDDVMIDVLRGEKLETEALDARADLIAERFSANREAEQIAIAAAAAEKEAFIQAAEIPPVEPSEADESPEPQVVKQAPVTETPAVEIPGPPVEESTPEVAETEESTPSLSDDVEWPEPTAETPEEEPTEEEPTEEEATEEEAEQEEPPAPQVEEPVSAVETPVAQKPITIPPPPPLPAAPAPMPPAIMPPPPLPAAPAPMPPAIMPPPPLPTAMPAPPGMSNIPPPPSVPGIPAPPVGATMVPPMAENQPLPTPPPVLVQAAPREDNLSDDEMDDLLGELSS